MRVATFIAIALLLSIGAGVVSAVGGASAGSALLTAILVLVGLQIAYFVFLAIKAALPRRDRDD